MQAKVKVKLPIAICIALVVVSASPVVQYTTVFVEPSGAICYQNRYQLPFLMMKWQKGKRTSFYN